MSQPLKSREIQVRNNVSFYLQGGPVIVTLVQRFLAPPWRLSLAYNFHLFLSNPTFLYSSTNISFILSSFYYNITQYSFISCKINKYLKLNLGLLQNRQSCVCSFSLSSFRTTPSLGARQEQALRLPSTHRALSPALGHGASAPLTERGVMVWNAGLSM